MSNAIPQTPTLTQRWQQLLYLVNSWVKKYGVVNVLAGPVFDHDADTFADDLYTVRYLLVFLVVCWDIVVLWCYGDFHLFVVCFTWLHSCVM